jgi:CRISP-associated protein Cas1
MSAPDLVPVRMLNEYLYCPRLAYLEWVQNEFVHNVHSIEGKIEHTRVDGGSTTAELRNDSTVIHHRSVMMSSEKLGIITVIDLMEEQDGEFSPIEYKHGPEPDLPERAWNNDLVQLCAQWLILKDNGYSTSCGYMFFKGSRTKVRYTFSDLLIEMTLSTIRSIREMAVDGVIPEPLIDSPKCPDCSLVTICLPDETLKMKTHDDLNNDTIRPLIPPRRDTRPLYLTLQGAKAGKSDASIVVSGKNIDTESIRFMDTSHVAVFGSVQLTTPLIQSLCNEGIPIVYFSHGGWFYGMTNGLGNKNAELRRNQFRTMDSDEKCLEIARVFVNAKIRNSRTILRRNSKGDVVKSLRQLNHYATRALRARRLDELLGIEGNAARIYFGEFSSMITGNSDIDSRRFNFEKRNRRPPRDPVNAMLSFAYAMLTKDFVVALNTVGFDPFAGFYHGMKHGRPALALDMMEMFRPLVADSVVINVINNGILQPSDFTERHMSVNLNPSGRKRFIQAYERRVDTLITHPVFDCRVSYRQVFEIQSRLLARYLAGEFDTVPVFLTR